LGVWWLGRKAALSPLRARFLRHAGIATDLDCNRAFRRRVVPVVPAWMQSAIQRLIHLDHLAALERDPVAAMHEAVMAATEPGAARVTARIGVMALCRQHAAHHLTHDLGR
jgi:hypothetical protein